MDQRDELRKLAEDKLVVASGAALDRVGEAAARLLADLYATGLEHGIKPRRPAYTDLTCSLLRKFSGAG